MKTCSKCGREKPFDEFHKSARSPDGYRPSCRKCRKVESRIYYEGYGDVVRARHADWYKTNREEVRIQHRAYYRANSDRAKSRATRWAKVNPSKRRQINRRHYANNKPYYSEYRIENAEKFRDYSAVYRASHREQIAGRNRRRRNAVRDNPVDLRKIAQRDGMTCHLCGGRVPRVDLTFDHLVPLSLGGEHVEWNLAVAHRSCNSGKRDRFISPAQPVLI